MGRSSAWIAWYGAFTVGQRVLMTWVVNATSGSLLPAILFHAMVNVGYALYPNDGSHFDPALAAGLTAVFAVCLVARGGAETLTGFPPSGMAP